MITNLAAGKRIRSKRSFKNIAASVIFTIACTWFNYAAAQNALDRLDLGNGTLATGAYSLRLLSNSYTGPLLRVNINSSYYDVYADASTAGIFSLNSPVSASYANYNDTKTGTTTNTLGAVLGSNSATVSTWYDQGGSGNDAMQADPSKQPAIAVSGVINTSSGLPSMEFNGHCLRAVLPSFFRFTPHTLNSVAAATTGAIVTLSSTTGPYQNSVLGAGYSGSGSAWFGGWFEDISYTTGSPITALSIRSKTYADTVIRGYFNGNYVFSMSPATGTTPYDLTTPDIVIGMQNNGTGSPLNGPASEVLVFTSLLNTADRQAVERNQSAYYGTAYTADAPAAPAVINPLTLDKLGLGSSVTATGAYALRRLSSAYTGPLVRITQYTSNAPVYYDVYPDASAAGAFSLSSPVFRAGSALDAGVHPSAGATLNDIVQGGTFTVAVWYDQSGNNNNVFNAIPSRQPAIISSGTILTTVNDLPAISFRGHFLRAVLPSLAPATPHTLIGVAAAAQGNIVALSSIAAGYQNSCLGASRGGQSGAWFGGYFEDSFFETGANTPALSVRTKTYTSADTTIRGYFNGSYVYAMNPAMALNAISYNPYNLTRPDILIGYQNTITSGGQLLGTGPSLSGPVSEVLVFTTALNTADRQAVESSEAAYYGIAYTTDAPPAPATGSPLTLDKAGLGSGVQATGAYSVRQLSSGYAGPLARLALTSNFGFAPTYYDVYPDAAAGAIASTSPIAFVGSAPDAAAHVSTGGTLNDLVQTNATYRVERWYDQSGNGNHVLNYYQFRQPVLVTGGTLITNPGGSPAFSFGNGAILGGRLPSLNPATAHTLNGVAAGTTGDIITLSSTHATGENSAVGISNTFNTAGAYGGWGQTGFSTGPATTAVGIRSKVYSPGSVNGYFNGANIFVNNTVTYNLTTPDILIGAETSISQYFNGTMSEAFAFTSALSDADLKSLGKNQANFYKIPYQQQNTVSKLLDSLTAAGATPATGAYALRLLNKNYTGPLLRVSLNNTYYDVYPDTTAAQKLSLGSPITQGYANYNDPQVTIATSFLSTVLGSDTVRVAIWYDQSGSGNDVMQSDATKQPVIAVSGVINTSSGLPSMLFNGRYLRAVLPSLNPLTPHTLNSVAAATAGAIVTLSSTTANYQNSVLGAGFFGSGSAWFGGWLEDAAYTTGSPTTALSIRSKTYADTVIRGYFNGSYVFSMSPATGGINAVPYDLTTPDIVIGLQTNGTATPLTGSASEVLVFTSLLNTADRQAVERNQSAYYSTNYTADAPPSPPVSNPLTLDKLGLGSSVTATGAYALRRLSSAYTGPLARITQSSGTAPVYYDVYPDASAAGAFSLSSPVFRAGSALDAAAHPSAGATLNDIIAGGNFTVALWYDQSGNNNNVLNSTAFYQPTIISSGAIITTPNGLPAMMFQGRFLRAVLPSLAPATPHTLVGVALATQGNIVALSSTSAGYQNSCLGAGRGGQSAAWFGGYFEDSFFETGAYTPALSIRSKTYTSADTTIRGYFNGSYVYAINPAMALNNISYNPYNLTTPDILIGYQNTVTSGGHIFGTTQALNGSASEVLVFTTALNTADRQAAESSEAAYYGIAYTADAPPAPATPSPLTLDKAGLGSGVQATGAYSVRQVSSAYTGPLARIENTGNFGFPPMYYDVYPDAATGAISSTSPIAMVGSAPDAAPHASIGFTLNGLVQTGATYRVEQWYDQSGNGNHVLNYYQFRQPVLVTGGTLITNPGGSPAFSFSSGAILGGRLPSLNPATAHTLNGVAAGTTGDIITLSSRQATGQNSAVGISNSFNTAGAYGGWGEFGFSTGPGTTAVGIRSKVYSPGSINGYFNGANIFVNNAVTYNLTTPDILIGAETTISQPLNGTLSEAFAFTSALNKTDLRALEKNQASFYNVLYTTKADTLVLAGATSPAGAAALSYTLTFEDTVTGLTADNFSLSASGGVTGASIGTPVTTDRGLNWTVPLNTGNGDGTLILSLINTQNLSMGLSNSLPLVADTLIIDKTVPVVSSIITVNTSPTRAPSVDYTVTFSEAVTGVDASDFTVTTTDSASGSVSGITGSGTTYTVTVSAVSGDGTLRLDLKDHTNVQDIAGNIAAGYASGQTYTIDHIGPVFSSGTGIWQSNNPQANWAKAGNDLYLHIGFNEAVQTDVVTIAGHPVTPASSDGGVSWDAHYTLTPSDNEGNVPFSFQGTDFAGNTGPLYNSSSFGLFLVVDNTNPTVTIGSPSPAVAGIATNVVTYNVTYADANFNTSTLSASDITLNATGTAAGTVGVANLGNTSTVTISNITGDGTLGISIGAATASDYAGNLAPAPDPSAIFTVDNIAPSVSSITRVAPSPSHVSNLDYTVTFSEAVTGLDGSDFTVAGTGTASGSVSEIGGSGTTYIVTVSQVSGDGTLRLDLKDNTDVQDIAGNIVAGYTSGQTYIIDNTAPEFQSGSGIWQSNNPEVNWAKAGDDLYLHISFKEAVQTDVVTINGHTVIPTSSDGGISWDAHYTLTPFDNEGNVPFTFQGTDFAGNIGPLYSSAPFGLSLIFDNTNPTVTIGSPSPAAAGIATNTVTYNVTYADANFNTSTLSASDITLNTTGTATGTVGVANSGNTSTVTISNISGNGTLGISVSAGTASDHAGNLAPAPDPSTTFTVDKIAPSVSSITRVGASPTRVTSVDYMVTFSKAVTGVDGSDFIVASTGTASGSISGITGSGTTYTVTISPVSGDGTLRLDLKDNTNVQDTVGNIVAGYTSGQTYIIDNTAPEFQSGSGIWQSNNPQVNWAKAGDDLYLHIGFKEAVQTDVVTINGHTVIPISSDGGVSWDAYYTLTPSDSEGNVPFSFQGTDFAGNVGPLYSSVPFGLTLIFDNTNPAVTIGPPSVASVSTGAAGPVTYSVTYADANFNASNLTTGDITLNSTGNANGTISLAGSGASYTVSITDITGIGTLGITIGAGKASDQAGNLADAAGPSATFSVFSNDATLSALTSTANNFAPTFDPNVTSGYTASVPNETTSVTITPTATNADISNLQVRVNGGAPVVVANGSASAPLALNVGNNTITVEITAQDSTTTKTYSLTVNRPPSNNIKLTTFKVTPGAVLTIVPGTHYRDYEASVNNSVSAVQVTAITQDATATFTVNGVPGTSGVASDPIRLNADTTTIYTTITAGDGVTRKTYAMKITRKPSNDAKLATFTTNPKATLTVVPGTDYKDYTATVTNSTSSISILAITHDATATLTVNGMPATSGTPSGPVSLNSDTTTIYTTVTAGDGVTRKTYAMKVTRQASNNAVLTSFTTTPKITLTAAAGTDYKDYTATVANSTSSISIIAVTQDATATLTVNGMPATSGTPSGPVSLNIDTTTIYTTVTAGDGVTKKTYALKVTRKPSDNAVLTAFATTPKATLTVVPGTDYRDYEATVSNSTSSISIIAVTQDATATLTVKGAPVTSGAASDPIHLNVDTNTIYTTVTAGDGITKKTYAIKVTRLPSNSAVLTTFTTTPKATLTAVAGTDYRDYVATVSNSTSSISIFAVVQDATATITVNGVPATSGTASEPVHLNVDTNTIYTTVTAGDGVTKKTYAILITRAAPPGFVMKYEAPAETLVTGDEIAVHQNVSPNGDGRSDGLVIEGIATHPDNRLQIMNRSGALIYEAKGYNNATKVFDGHSSINGKLQQAGTYFYSLEYKDGNETKRKTGFFVLKY